MASASRPVFFRLVPGLALGAALALGGCINNSAYEDLMQAQPNGSPFARALFQDYSYLARSFGIGEAPSTTAFDASDSISIASLDSDVADVANAYAEKALVAARGEEPLPEPAPTDDEAAEKLRMRLLRALDQGRAKAPAAAARAQADYDCWVLNGTVDSLAAAAAACQRSFNASLPRLESQLNPVAAPASAAAPSADFTALFGLNSAELTADGIAVLRRAIDTARAGRQSRIAVVGHTDTLGSPPYNVTLSKKRAQAIRDALVRMGARPAAIQISGVGEEDLAVQTPDGVAEAKNRRAAVTLIP